MDRDHECRNNRCSFCDVPLVGKRLGKGRSALSRPRGASQSGVQRSTPLTAPQQAVLQEHVQHGQREQRPEILEISMDSMDKAKVAWPGGSLHHRGRHVWRGQGVPHALVLADSSGHDRGEPANWHNLQQFLRTWIEANGGPLDLDTLDLGEPANWHNPQQFLRTWIEANGGTLDLDTLD